MMKEMSLNSSNSRSASFDLLHFEIRRWIFQKGWEELRDIQERSIPLILQAKRDVIIQASTASGKTEAAFMPILTRLLESAEPPGVALYISPLKALINDQWSRLDQLCEELRVPVTPWHGDVTSTKKKRFLREPGGCVLITPESLEALVFTKGSMLKQTLAGLQYVVVDELHAFIGSERGTQLQSLMNRLEVIIGRRVPRIALSATLGDPGIAAEFLRPGAGLDVELVKSSESSASPRVIVRGYLEAPPSPDNASKQPRADGEGAGEADPEQTTDAGAHAIARHLYERLRGTNNLVFPNSRRQVEQYASILRSISEQHSASNEFWPHHGNLSKEMREETERALKQSERAATAIATSTLEMGIDIGAVESVAQIGPAPSVSSLRQRMGRSGRRKGTVPTLRGYALEQELNPRSTLADALRESLVQFGAQIAMLEEDWYEPPRAGGMHLSTFVQQLLSAIGQYGTLAARDAYVLLCERGPFRAVSKDDFLALVKSLGAQRVLTQDSDGKLMHGEVGEKIVNHYSFYAAFSSPEEYRLMWAGHPLGSLPITFPVSVGDYLLFGGKRWKVERVAPDEKAVDVVPARGGRAPYFGGSAGIVHTRVREKMKEILADSTPFRFFDAKAKEMLEGARATYRSAGLASRQRLPAGTGLLLFLWQGDEIQNTFARLLRSRGITAQNQGLVVVVEDCDETRLDDTLRSLAESAEVTPFELLQDVENLSTEKWDTYLPSPLRERNYASLYLDLPGTYALLRSGKLCQPAESPNVVRG
jgi:ATP-dependent Lhr-like helicase